jgi:hypothetical protein
MAIAVRSFAAGELAPALYARTDLAKYQQGLMGCLNWLIMKSGGAENRPGGELVDLVRGDTDDPARLIPWVRGEGEAAALLFTERRIQIAVEGALVAVEVGVSASAWATSTDYAEGDLAEHGGVVYESLTWHTSAAGTEPGVGASWATAWRLADTYHVVTPYLAQHLSGIRYAQTADLMVLTHPDYPPATLVRSAAAAWVYAALSVDPAVATPANVSATSGNAGTRYYAVTAVTATGEESLASVPVTDANSLPDAANPVVVAWDPVPGALSYRVYRGETESSLGFIGTGGGMPIEVTDTGWTDSSEAASTTSPGAWTAAAGQARNPLGAISATNRAYDQRYTVTGTLTVSASGGTPTVTEGRLKVYYKRDAETRVLAETIEGSQYRAYGVSTFGPVPWSVTITVPDNGYAALEIDVVPEVLGAETAATVTYTATVSTASGAVTWWKNGTGFSDAALAADPTDTPPVTRATFGTAGEYPTAVTFYQQRLVLAATTARPETTWASQTARRTNFTVAGIVADDEAVEWTLSGKRVSAIRHLTERDDLLEFTSGGIHVIRGNADGVLTPAGINPRQISTQGASATGTLAPIVAGSRVLYVQARGSVVRELAPTDGGDYGGADLTVLSSHMVTGYTLVDWAMQEAPTPTLWAVRSDGVVLTLTYVPEYDVLAWSRQAMAPTVAGDAVAENVCVIPEGDEDRVYLVVTRTVDGAAVRTLERLTVRTLLPDTDATDVATIDAVGFVDAAVVEDGWRSWTLTGGLVVGSRATLTGGTTWLAGESLTLTITTSVFVGGDVGGVFLVADDDGVLLRLIVTAVATGFSATVEPEAPVPASMQAVPAARWARGTSTVTGLDHLEGEAVAVVADGEVVSSPRRTGLGEPVDDSAVLTVSGGSVTLPTPRAHVRVGLPYVCDLETLDIDQPGGQSLKPDTKIKMHRVGLMVSRSRGLWVARGHDADDADFREVSMRDTSDWSGVAPLATGYVEASIPNGYTTHGRVLVRQVDPLPATILSVMPVGSV